MRLRDFHRFGEITSLPKEDIGQRSAVVRRDRNDLGVGTNAAVLVAQFPRIQLPALVVLPHSPREHFLGAPLLVRLGERRGTWPKQKDDLLHG